MKSKKEPQQKLFDGLDPDDPKTIEILSWTIGRLTDMYDGRQAQYLRFHGLNNPPMWNKELVRQYSAIRMMPIGVFIKSNPPLKKMGCAMGPKTITNLSEAFGMIGIIWPKPHSQ